MKGYLKAGDTISGQEGRAQININGQIHSLFEVKTVEASVEKTKAEVKTIGHRGTQSKTIGWSGTGSMTLHYASSLFRKLVVEYIKTGKDFYFDMIITNEDPASSLGKQTTALYNCNLNGVVLAKLDVDSESLEEELEFTFDDVDLLDEFKKPNYIK